MSGFGGFGYVNPEYVEISRSRLAWLRQQYLSPLTGMRQIAASLMDGWGYEPAEYPALIDELEAEIWEALSDTAYAVMREHGLRGPADA